MRLEDYGKNRKVEIEDWITRSGIVKATTVLIPRTELAKILKAYRAYVYEAEFRPEVKFNGEEIDMEEL